jgi:hypothetical protein
MVGSELERINTPAGQKYNNQQAGAFARAEMVGGLRGGIILTKRK